MGRRRDKRAPDPKPKRTLASWASPVLWSVGPAPLIWGLAKVLGLNDIAGSAALLFALVAAVYLYMVHPIDEGIVRKQGVVLASTIAIFIAALVGRARFQFDQATVESKEGTPRIVSASAQETAIGLDSGNSVHGSSEDTPAGSAVHVVIHTPTKSIGTPSGLHNSGASISRAQVPADPLPLRNTGPETPPAPAAADLDARIASLEAGVDRELGRANFFGESGQYENAFDALRDGMLSLSAYRGDRRVEQLAARLSDAELSYRRRCERARSKERCSSVSRQR